MAKSKKDAGGECLIATVDAEQFAKRLGFVQGALPRRNTVPILDCVLLTAGPGLVRLAVTNLDQMSEVTLQSDTKAAGAICVDARRLLAVVSRFSGEMLIAQEGTSLKLTGGRARAELPVLPAGDFAGMRGPEEDGETFEIASGALASGFASVMHACSKEETRYYLNGVYMQPDGGDLKFTATDGTRLASLKVTSGLPGGTAFAPCIVPDAMLRDFVKFCERADGPVAMTVSDDRLQLSAAGETHITKLIDGTFPDYERVIPKGPGTRINVAIADLKRAVAVAMTGSTEKSMAVRFEAEEGRLTCRSREEGQWAEGIVEGTDIPPCVAFGLNGKLPLQALEACRGETVELVVIDPASPVRFETGDELRQVVMPLRV